MAADHRDAAKHVESRGALVDQKCRDAAARAFGLVGHRHQDGEIGVLGAADPDLAAVDHPFVAVANRAGDHRSRIGAGAGLGNADRRYRLAARVGPEIGLALLFIGGDHQHAQIGRVRRKRVGRHRLAQLLVDPDHGLHRQVRAAELARRIEPPQSELTGLGVDGLALRFRQSGSLAAAFALEYLRLERHERVGDEARHQLLEHPMLFAELEIHEPSLGWRPPQFTWVSRAMASASPSAPGRRHESCPTSAGSARGLPPRSGARACRRPGEAAQRALPGPLTKILGNSRSNFLRRII